MKEKPLNRSVTSLLRIDAVKVSGAHGLIGMTIYPGWACGTFLSIYLFRVPTLGFLFLGHEKYAEFAASVR